MDIPSLWILGLSFFFFAFIFTLIRESLYCVSAYRLEKIYSKKRDQDFQKKVDLYLDKQEEMIWVAITLQGLVNFCFVLLLAVRFLQPPYLWSSIFLLSLLCSLYFLFSALLPKILAGLLADSILYSTLSLTYKLTSLFFPLMVFLKFLEKIAGRLRGIREDSELKNAREEIIEAAKEGERHGLLAGEGQKMIESLIHFTGADVATAMVPRTDMNTLDVETSVEDSAQFALKTGHSRIPIYEDNKDKIIGVLYVKDLIRYWMEQGEKGDLRSILRKPYFVPDTKAISSLLHELKAKKVHIAIVLDEYGGTAGLITIEDILEEIVGEIDDEYDVEEKEPSFRKISDYIWEVDARIHMDELNDELHLELPEDEDYETLGGFVISHLGRIPKAGETFDFQQLDFSVLEGDERKIIKVQITLPSE